MQELENMILSGLLNGQIERWTQSMVLIDPRGFTGDRGKLFAIMKGLFQATGRPMDKEALLASLSTLKNKATAVAISTVLESLNGDTPTDAQFAMALHSFQESVLDRQFNGIVTNALEINAKGLAIGGKELEGREAAIAYLMANLPSITSTSDSTATDVLLEGESVVAEYEKAREGSSNLIFTHLRDVDAVARGFEPGDFVMVEGFTGDGKTMFCCNFAHNVACIEGRTVLYCTSETVAPRIRRRIFCRHSSDPRFETQIPYSDLKHGTLTEQQERVMHEVVKDLDAGRRSGKYGSIFVMSLTKGISSVQSVIRTVRQCSNNLALVVIDYLALLAAERVDLVDIVRTCKGLAVSEQLVIVSPWQTSITAWEAAMKAGSYRRASMSETSEAEKSADAVITLLRDPDDVGRLLCKFTKLRDEGEGDVFSLSADFAHSTISDYISSMGSVSL